MKILSTLCLFLLFCTSIATAEGYLPQRIEHTSPTEHFIYTFTYDSDNKPTRIKKENLPTDQTPNANISLYDYTYNPDNTIKQVVLSKYTTEPGSNQNVAISQNTFNYRYDYIQDTLQLTVTDTYHNQTIPEANYSDTHTLKIVTTDSGYTILDIRKEVYPRTGYYSETTKIDFVNGDVNVVLINDHFPESVFEIVLHQDNKEGIYKNINWPLYLQLCDSNSNIGICMPNLSSLEHNTINIDMKGYFINPYMSFEYEYNQHNYPSKVSSQDDTYQIEYIHTN